MFTCKHTGGAGAESQGLWGRVQAFFRGRSGAPDAIKIRDISPELIEEAAVATEGFSGRELAKLVASMQVASRGHLHAAAASSKTMCIL